MVRPTVAAYSLLLDMFLAVAVSNYWAFGASVQVQLCACCGMLWCAVLSILLVLGFSLHACRALASSSRHGNRCGILAM